MPAGTLDAKQDPVGGSAPAYLGRPAIHARAGGGGCHGRVGRWGVGVDGARGRPG